MQHRAPVTTRILIGFLSLLALAIGTSAMAGQPPAANHQMSFVFKDWCKLCEKV